MGHYTGKQTNPPGYKSESREKGFGVKKSDGDGSEWRAIHGNNNKQNSAEEQRRDTGVLIAKEKG